MHSPSLETRREIERRVRELTGLGMMSCWRLLVQNGWDERKGWDEQKIFQWLGLQPKLPAAPIAPMTEAELKGVANPIQQDLKAGMIASYIHMGRVGSLVEINCETEAVAQSEGFQRLAKDIAIQVCASEHLSYVSPTDISLEAIAQERARVLKSFDSENQANNVVTARHDQTVASRIQQRLEILPLLQQPCRRNHGITLQARIDEVQEIVGEPIQVRRWVKFCLWDSSKEPMVAQLQSHAWKLEAIYSSNSWVRFQAVAAASTFGESAFPYLLRALQDSEGAIRYRAAESLGVLGNSSYVPALIQTLQDPENWVRWKAAKALGRLKDLRAVPALVELLKNHSGCVFLGVKRSGCWAFVDSRALHRIAADALVEIGDPKTIELLLQTLSDREGCKSLPSGAKPQEIAALLQRLGYSLSPGMIPD